MTIINNFTELKQLQSGEKFYVVSGGDNRSYWYVGNHPKSENLCVAIWDADYTTAKVFSQNSFRKNVTILHGQYESAIMGEIMVKQLESEIESINTIYLKQPK